ncbi:MAG: hypothetical protein KME49_16945 [Brasilonema octagenarum HA4186-MV1]|jgi:hypothetical protein|nr:hypothetical protein [Brasilonema octagenarum HA4186-MV1]
MPTARLRLSGTPVVSVGKPLRVRQMPAEGDPPAALVSPPAALSHQIPLSGNPHQVLAHATCLNALNPRTAVAPQRTASPQRSGS